MIFVEKRNRVRYKNKYYDHKKSHLIELSRIFIRLIFAKQAIKPIKYWLTITAYANHTHGALQPWLDQNNQTH